MFPDALYPSPDATFAPDGDYVPRVIFFGPDGSALGTTTQTLDSSKQNKIHFYFVCGVKRDLC